MIVSSESEKTKVERTAESLNEEEEKTTSPAKKGRGCI